MEQAINFQVIEHFVKNNLFHKNNNEGLANHCTTTAIIQVSDMILKAAEKKKLSAALLLDQCCAYDLLDHVILLRKLTRYGFHADTVQWFKSYLTGRSQSVQVEAQQSAKVDLGRHENSAL